MKSLKITGILYVIAFMAALLFVYACSKNSASLRPGANSQTTSTHVEKFRELEKIRDVKASLVELDSNDFVSYSLEEWLRRQGNYEPNIRVYWPEGSQTLGKENYTSELLALFAYAPDARITEHPMLIGTGNRTAITGTIEGTFTKSMEVDGGKTIYPTGKKFSIPVSIISIWENGRMTEKHLYWDNQLLLVQLGFLSRR